MLDKQLEEKLAALLSDGKNKYQVINAVSRRARDLNEGMIPLVPNTEGLDPLQISLAELKADKLKLTLGAPSEGDEDEEQA